MNLCNTYTGTASSRLLPLITIQNTGYPDAYTVDTDWYEFTLDSDQVVTITGESEFPPQAAVMFGCPATQIVASTPWNPSCTGVYSLNVASGLLVAGTYYYRISPRSDNATYHSSYHINDCDHGSRYWFRITGAAPCPPPCPADFNGVGGLSVQDIFDFLAAYFANDPRADFNGAGGISVQDIFDFLAAYFAGCP